MLSDKYRAKTIGGGLAIMGMSSLVFAVAIAWDVYELVTLGEVLVQGRMRVIIESGRTLLWFHGVFFVFSTVSLWLYYKDYKNEVRRRSNL